MTTTCGAVTISLFSIYTLARWSLPGLALSIIEAFALLAVYGTPLRMPAKSETLPFVDIETDIASFTLRVTVSLLIALALQTLFLGFGSFEPGTTLRASVANAFSWYFDIRIVRHVFHSASGLVQICISTQACHLSWTAVVVIKILAIFASRNPFTQSFEM
ncbi:glycosyltransferase family 90 protein [Penicillium odoratum]|uniref:glycosyltransferase family 90 protein n=1 Tax=Penicillium odoratum TaxID=1167516 RepID=UPI0025465E59|nr:glycosyltransferase family 90 protein [Penicillium odoratum]KAJ5745707.1 glycosyltransferase family 90 protein [Penicillium odoratum]